MLLGVTSLTIGAQETAPARYTAHNKGKFFFFETVLGIGGTFRF